MRYKCIFYCRCQSCSLWFAQIAWESSRLHKMEIFTPEEEPKLSTFQFWLVRVWKVHFIVRIISDSFHPAIPISTPVTIPVSDPLQELSVGFKTMKRTSPLAKKLHVACWKNFCPGFRKTLIPAIIRLAVASGAKSAGKLLASLDFVVCWRCT